MKYCKQCNASLRDDVVFCSECGTPVEKPSNRCDACGSILPEGATHCLNCDRKIDGAPSTPVVIANEGSYQSEQTNYNSTAYTSTPISDIGDKSKVTAGVLAFIIGTLGVHSFYLGFTSKGILQLALTLLSCGLFAPIVAVWALIDGIKILTDDNYVDAQGKRLK
ncbi:MAG: TM2 domain-containing protein [Clostridia bacterium]